MMIIIAIVIGGLTIGVIVFMVMLMLHPERFSKDKYSGKQKKQEEKKKDTKGGEDAKEFLPISDVDGIKDGIIDLGRHRYRAILEVSSLNYFFYE